MSKSIPSLLITHYSSLITAFNSLLLRRVLVARERVREYVGNLLPDLVQLLLGGVLELLYGRGVRLLDPGREPVLLGEVEARDADADDGDDDAEEHVAEVVYVTDQRVDGAVEDEARARHHRHPHQAARERKEKEARVRHLRHAVEGARAPAQPVRELRDEDGERPELLRQALDARARRAVEGVALHSVAPDAPQRVGRVVARHARERPDGEHQREAVWAERLPVRQHPRQQQSD